MRDGHTPAPTPVERDAAERMVALAGVSARIAAVSVGELDAAITDGLDDLLLHLDATRWTLVLDGGDGDGDGETLGGAVTPVVLLAVEEALRGSGPLVVLDPATVAEPDGPAAKTLLDAGVASVLAVPAAAAGQALGVLVIERTTACTWDASSMGLIHAIADILAGGLARRRAEEAARRADDRYRRLLETSAEGVCLLDARGIIRFANRSLGTLVGSGRGSLVGIPILRFLNASDGTETVARLLHETGRFEVELHLADGTHRWASCSTSALRDDVAGASALVMMTDISIRRAAEAALRHSEARFRALIRSSSDVIVVTNGNGDITYASPAIHDVLGHDPASLIGTSPLELVHADDLPAVQTVVSELWAARTGSSIVRCRIATADGGFRPMEAALTNLIDDSAVAGMSITARDISAQLELQAALAHDATHDAVTGLSNRRVFNKRLSQLLRSGRDGVTILFADLDGFKAVNDTLGHDVGDELLRLVGQRLEGAVRDCDLVVRHGGDEFAILCPGLTSTDEAEAVAGRVVKTLSSAFVIRDVDVVVGISIGIAQATPEAAPSARTLLAAADAAMYRAKGERLGWCFPTAEAPSNRKERRLR